jgi:hypothetical protein
MILQEYLLTLPEFLANRSFIAALSNVGVSAVILAAIIRWRGMAG